MQKPLARPRRVTCACFLLFSVEIQRGNPLDYPLSIVGTCCLDQLCLGTRLGILTDDVHRTNLLPIVAATKICVGYVVLCHASAKEPNRCLDVTRFSRTKWVEEACVGFFLAFCLPFCNFPWQDALGQRLGCRNT